jgi:AcrR family transcriptional regulator
MKQANDPVALDGRRLRSERSKQAIIDAVADMIDEGNLIPTAQQASDRAGVGIRTVFRHFSDMETLFTIADEQRRAYFENLFKGGDRSGSLAERVEKIVDFRGDKYDRVSNVARSALAQRWRYSTLHQNYARYQRALRLDLEDWLPEAKTLGAAKITALEGLLSFEFWDRLRDHQNLNVNEAKSAIVDTIRALFNL